MSIHATVIGRLGRDPEVRQVGQHTVCNFNVATNYGWGEKQTTTWVRVAVWGKTGEPCARFLRKGSEVGVSGVLHTREHDGKTYVELDGKHVDFIGPKTSASGDRDAGGGGYGGGNRGRTNPAESRPPDERFADDAIPF
jgi:single-strand DNA-binding protein